MLPKSAYQTIAACMLYDSNLPKSVKLEHLEFIENASEKQIMHYLIHDEMVSEQEIELVGEGFILATALLFAASSAGRALYNKNFSDGAKACRDKGGVAKKMCMRNFKVKGISAKIAALRREMGKCSQTAKPDKCRKMFATYIRNAEKEMRRAYSQ